MLLSFRLELSFSTGALQPSATCLSVSLINATVSVTTSTRLPHRNASNDQSKLSEHHHKHGGVWWRVGRARWCGHGRTLDGRYTLPVLTARKYGPWTRVVCTEPKGGGTLIRPIFCSVWITARLCYAASSTNASQRSGSISSPRVL